MNSRISAIASTILIISVAVLHAVVHYFYIYTIIPADKEADWINFGVFPVGLSVLLIYLYKYSQKITLRFIVPVYLFIIALLITAYFYYTYFDTILNIPLMIEMTGAIDVGSIKHVIGYAGIGIVFGAIAAVGFIAGAVVLSFKVQQIKKVKVTAVIIIFLILCIQPLRTMLDIKRPVAMKYKLAKTRIIVNAGLPYYLVYDYLRVRDVKYSKPAPEDLLVAPDQIIDPNAPLPKRYKYILVIQIESLNNSILGYTLNGKEVTPYLNTLKKESYYFPHMFSDHLLGSVDADFSTLTGLIPNKEQLTYNYALNHVPSLPRFLKENGYNSYFFHPLRGSFFNHEKAFKEMGADECFGRDAFIDHGNGWEVPDSRFFTRTLEIMNAYADEGNPAFYFLVTIQTHGPYRNHSYQFVSDDEINLMKKKYPSDVRGAETMMHYFNAVYETDAALKDFMSALQKKPWAKDTVIVIFGDHVMEENTASLFDSRNGFKGGIENVPLFIILPGVKGKTMEQPVSHIDIAPTIAYLCGFAPSVYWAGSNAFLKDKTTVLGNGQGVFLNGSDIYYADGISYDILTKKEKNISTELQNKYNDEIRKKLLYSHGWFYGFRKQ